MEEKKVSVICFDLKSKICSPTSGALCTLEIGETLGGESSLRQALRVEILSAFSGALHDEGIHLRLIRAVGAEVADRHGGLHHQKRIVRERRHRILALAILLLHFGRLLKNNVKKRIKQSGSSKTFPSICLCSRRRARWSQRKRALQLQGEERSILQNLTKIPTFPTEFSILNNFWLSFAIFCEDFCENSCENSCEDLIWGKNSRKTLTKSMSAFLVEVLVDVAVMEI